MDIQILSIQPGPLLHFSPLVPQHKPDSCLSTEPASNDRPCGSTEAAFFAFCPVLCIFWTKCIRARSRSIPLKSKETFCILSL